MIHDQAYVSKTISEQFPDATMFEITYVTAGSGVRKVLNTRTKIAAGDYFLSEPDAPSLLSNTNGLEVIRIAFISTLIDHAFTTARTYRELAYSYLLRFKYKIATSFSVTTVYHDREQYIGALASKLCDEYAYKADGNLEYIRCYILLIILDVFRQCSLKEATLAFDSSFIQIYDYCCTHYAEEIKLGDLCKKIHYSQPYISNRFKELRGCTFTQFIQKLRVEESCRLLISSEKKVMEIAHAVGYQDVQSFFKVFKKYMRMTPLQYRKTFSGLSEN